MQLSYLLLFQESRTTMNESWMSRNAKTCCTTRLLSETRTAIPTTDDFNEQLDSLVRTSSITLKYLNSYNHLQRQGCTQSFKKSETSHQRSCETPRHPSNSNRQKLGFSYHGTRRLAQSHYSWPIRDHAHRRFTCINHSFLFASSISSVSRVPGRFRLLDSFRSCSSSSFYQSFGITTLSHNTKI